MSDDQKTDEEQMDNEAQDESGSVNEASPEAATLEEAAAEVASEVVEVVAEANPEEEAAVEVAAAESSDGKRWFVIHAYSGYENYVVKALRERISSMRMEDRFDEIVVPTEEVVEMRGGKKKTSTRLFFPGYVLVRMDMDDATWHFVKSVPRVLGFIGGTSEKPAPITDKEANSILRRVEEGESKPRPKVLYEPGEVVRVNDGPFTDFNGVVEAVNYEKSRLRVAVSIFGRSTPVELEFGQVEKA